MIPFNPLDRAFGDCGAMPGEWLAADMRRYFSAMPMGWLDLLTAIGVDLGTLDLLVDRCAIGAARVIEQDGRWDEAEQGAPSLILPVWQHGALADLIALSSGEPGRWSLRTGHACVLGDMALPLAHESGALRLFSTPLAWLAGAGEGLCVLRWDGEALNWLRSLGPRVTLLCDSAAAADRLGQLLAWQGLPQVRGVETDERIAA